MKTNKTISLLMIAAITVISFSSCTVRYNARHPNRYHRDYNYVPKLNHDKQTVSVDSASSHSLSASR